MEKVSIVGKVRGLVIHLPTEKYNNRVTFCRNEAEHKDVLATAVIALGDGLAQRALCVQDDLLMLGSDKMVDNM